MNYKNRVTVTFLLGLSMFSTACTYTELASVSSTGAQANNHSDVSNISGDGRFVVFWSGASNLVANDTNGRVDVFLRDALNGTTSRLSLTSGGNQIDYNLSGSPLISANGQIASFNTRDDTVVPNDTNNTWDVFLVDLTKNETTRVSVDSSGNQANGQSSSGGLSDDGRYIVFTSFADNLVPGDTNGVQDVFVHDRIFGITTRVNVDSAGKQSNAGMPNGRSTPSISGDGRYVAFTSLADNLVSGDTNNVADVFIHDLVFGSTARVSVSNFGLQANGASESPMLSTDGKSISFLSEASNLVAGDTNGKKDVFVHRIFTWVSTTARVNVSSAEMQANDQAFRTAMSGDGRYISFYTPADNLVADDTNGAWDVFVRDTAKGITRRISKSRSGAQGNATSSGGSISKDGRYISFESSATNLANDDLNGVSDVFIRALQEVEVTSIVPSMIPVGTTQSVTLTGKDFFPGTTPSIDGSNVSSVVIVNENTITMDVTVNAGSATGVRDVLVTLGGTGLGPFSGSAHQCTACVTFF